jgi:hypothetical protein
MQQELWIVRIEEQHCQVPTGCVQHVQCVVAALVLVLCGEMEMVDDTWLSTSTAGRC